MSKEKPKTYTAEFRASAVKLANESEKPIAETVRELGVNENTLHTWINKYSRPLSETKPVRTDEYLYDELKRLKQENARLREEREILKKRRRTLPESNGEVRLDKATQRYIYGRDDVSVPGGFPECLLRLARPYPDGPRTGR